VWPSRRAASADQFCSQKFRGFPGHASAPVGAAWGVLHFRGCWPQSYNAMQGRRSQIKTANGKCWRGAM
jgi:hypothetical protein